MEFYFLVLFWGHSLECSRNNSWFSAQGSLLTVLKDHVVSEINSRTPLCKEVFRPKELSFWSCLLYFKRKCVKRNTHTSTYHLTYMTQISSTKHVFIYKVRNHNKGTENTKNINSLIKTKTSTS